MRVNISNRDYEKISAYLDGQLSVAEMTRLEEQIRTNPMMRQALDEMGRTRAILRLAPRLRAPRSFVLTPAMIAEKSPRKRNLFSLFPVLSFTSAIATLALVVSFIFGSTTGLVAQNPATDFSQQSSVQAEMSIATETMAGNVEAPNAAMKAADSAENMGSESQNAPVITWGFPQDNYSPSGKYPMGSGSLPAMGMGGGGGGGASDLGFDGSSSGTFNGQLVIPYDESQSASPDAVQSQAQEFEKFSDVPTLEGTGPVLGLPADGQEGQYLYPLPTPISESVESSRTSQSTIEPEVRGGNNPSTWLSPTILWIIRILLGLTALISGGVAWWLWQKNR